jgi:serine/threonine protein kinase
VSELVHQRYQPERPLGEGGFARTRLARDLLTGQLCVLKELHFQQLPDWKGLELFERETRTLRNLQHPAIPALIDAFQEETPQGPRWVLVQTYVEGHNLQQWVESGRRFTEAEAIDITRQLCQVLVYLQAFSPPIIHRDIKPSNVLLDPQGKVSLIDFGAVKEALAPRSSHSMTVVGTFGYMPLEQLDGKAVPATDIYAVGCTLVYLLTGQDPSTLDKKQLRPDFEKHIRLSPVFGRILAQMLAADVKERYPNASAVLRALETSPPPQVQPHALKIGILIVLGCGLLGGLITLALSKGPSSPRPPTTKPANIPLKKKQFQATQLTPWEELAAPIYHFSEGEAGGVWASTSTDLCQMDTNGLKHCQSLMALSGSYHGIKHLAARSDQEVWWSTHQSMVYRYHQDSVTPFKPPGVGTLNDLAVYQGQALIAQGSGLWRWDEGAQAFAKWKDFPHLVTLLQRDQDGHLWVVSGTQLWKYASGHWQKYWQGQRVYVDAPQAVTAIQGKVWITTSEGIFEFVNQKPQLRLQIRNINSLALTEDGSLWASGIGSNVPGLYRYRQQKWQTFGFRHGLSNDRFKQTYASPSTGHLWLLDEGHHLLRAPGAAVAALTPPTVASLPHQAYPDLCQAWSAHKPSTGDIRSDQQSDQLRVFVHGQQVCPTGKGFLSPTGVMVTHNYLQGLRRWERGSYRLIPPPGKSVSIQTLYLDRHNDLWLTPIYPYAIYNFSHGTWKSYHAATGFAGKTSPLLAESKQGKMIAASRLNNTFPLLTYQDNQWLASRTQVSGFFQQPEALLALSDGRMAVGTGSGLMIGYPDTGTVQQFLAQVNVAALAEDPQGRIWAVHNAYGTQGHGLSVIDPVSGNTHTLTSRTGLKEDRLRYVGSSGNTLWLIDHWGAVQIYALDALWKAAHTR